MALTSPLRYPGGKSRFTDFIWKALAASGEKAEVFVEPFCGGAGAAIRLLESGRVERIALNDKDPLVASFWQVVFGKSRKNTNDVDWLIRQIESAKLSIAEWRRQKTLNPLDVRTAAWKCLYLNRTSFNGILHKAGPIGGWEQKNRTLDVRFNPERLIEQVQSLYALRDQVERVDCVSWKRYCMRYQHTRGVYLYLDPPYYHKADQLYGYFFDKKTHLSMRKYLVNLSTPWMLSYDDVPEVRSLYGNLDGIDGRVVDQTYSAHPMGGASFVGRELFFSNRALPSLDLREGQRPHTGITVLGALKNIAPHAIGPLRTPTAQQAPILTIANQVSNENKSELHLSLKFNTL
ncbi:DNA adenine methylase [Pontibacter russatus]|uniref:DNA adenine methylase n=1 Tax=Pontibacter russatus TaxID=2694929 RepID=UPI00137A650E|nr:DNA adenine methylase [Pontibacter russatus]